jgi:hypothetical protein
MRPRCVKLGPARRCQRCNGDEALVAGTQILKRPLEQSSDEGTSPSSPFERNAM